MAVSPESNFKSDLQGTRRPAQPDHFGTGVFGVFKFSVSDKTRTTWTRVAQAVGVVLLFAAIAQADTFTPGIGLRKPTVGVEDPVTRWGDKHNTNQDLLDAAICDKNGVCTIVGQWVFVTSPTFAGVAIDSATISEMEVSTLTVTTGSYLLGLNILGSKTAAELKSLSCPTYCLAYNTDILAIFESTGTLQGQFRNIRTGTGP